MSQGQPIPLEQLAEGLRAHAKDFHVEDFTELISCDRLSGGANQETYRVEARTDSGTRTIAIRRSVGGLANPATPGYPGLRAEAMLMKVARAAGVPEPEVYWIFEAGDGLGEGFAMQWIDGETLGKRIVNSDDLADARTKLAFQCGQILARIHAVDTGGELGQLLHTIAPDAFLEQTYARYRNFDTPQPMIDYTARWLRERLPKTPELRLVHNDFRNGNIMVSRTGVVAVLDWELAHIGDPMRDLGWLCTNSWRFGRSDLPVGGFGTYEDLFAGYESVTGIPMDRDRVEFWEVFGSFWWAVGCLEMANAYRGGIDRGIERAAIGRRTSECQVDCVNLIMPGPVDLIAAPETPPPVEMPTTGELLGGVRDFLRADVMNSAKGRSGFLARVSANALDIVIREAAVGHLHRAAQQQRLRQLLDSEANLETLTRKLADGLRSGVVALDQPGLVEHLRQTVVNQVAIDQPRYSGLKTALARK